MNTLYLSFYLFQFLFSIYQDAAARRVWRPVRQGCQHSRHQELQGTLTDELTNGKSAQIGARKCNFPFFLQNHDDQTTNKPTHRRTGGILGKLHFHWQH